MKISTILDHIDSGHMALPEFQRGYRCFISVEEFRRYVDSEILAGEPASAGS
jgi:hypothetical protein